MSAARRRRADAAGAQVTRVTEVDVELTPIEAAVGAGLLEVVVEE